MKFLKKSRCMQYLFTVIAAFSSTSIEVYMVWTSPTLPKLTTDESYAGVKLSSVEASWMTSVIFLGLMVGGMFAAWFLDMFGRKKTLLLGGLFMFLPWIALSFPLNGIMMIVARFVGGFGGSFAAIANIYIGEITDKDIRGKLLLLSSFISTCGRVIILAIGPFVSYKVLNLVCGIIPFVFTFTFFFASESPYYLIKINRLESAKKTIRQLQNKMVTMNDIEDRFNEIKQTVENDMKYKTTLKDLLMRKDYRKSIVILLGVRTLQQFSGLFAINSYMQTIMEMTETSLPSNWISVIYGVVQLPAVLISAFLIDHVGRRPLLAISCFGCFLTLTTLGVFFYFDQKTEINLENINFLPVACLSFYIVLISFGIHTIPYVLLGEMFATNVKSIGVLLFSGYGGILGFAMVKSFEPVAEAVGMYSVFWFFGGCCFLGIIFSFVVLPETKKKSLAEVQKTLNTTST